MLAWKVVPDGEVRAFQISKAEPVTLAGWVGLTSTRR